MITVDDHEQIRRAYFIEQKSKRQIARELQHSRSLVDRAVALSEASTYHQTKLRAAPILGPFKTRLDELLVENETLPRKQRYTSHVIFQKLRAEGYAGGESTVRGYISHLRQSRRHPAVYLPLEFDPGIDAQVDWGEAEVVIAGQPAIAQLFVLRLCYSRRIFVMAFPTQKQESFFEGHVQAFQYFGGVPHRLSYDNLRTAIDQVLSGRQRKVNERFILLRSHYLFESRFCTPGEGHEKGGVEHGVGYARRNFLAGRPTAASYDELNAQLRAACAADDQRRSNGQTLTLAEAFAQERPHLQPLPACDFDCCVTVPVTLNPYSQVTFETNRYSVPVERGRLRLTLKAYSFRVEIWDERQLLATHPRSYARDQDLFEPRHYLPLFEQRPGAFEHARPLREWRKTWPAVYEQLLSRLQAEWPDGRGLREFIQVLKLHQDHPEKLIEQAVTQALALGCVHLDGVRLCVHQLYDQPVVPGPIDLTARPQLANIGTQPLDLQRYDQLLLKGV